MKLAASLPKDKNLLINMSGRGDKDLDYVCISKEGVFAGPPSN